MTLDKGEIQAIAKAVAAEIMAQLGPLGQHKRLLDIKSAAQYLSRSPSSIRHMIVTGDLPGSAIKRIGRRVFIVRTELDRWLECQ